MEKVQEATNLVIMHLYDLLGYALPGSLLVFAIMVMASPYSAAIPKVEQLRQDWLWLIVAGYVFGYPLQALAGLIHRDMSASSILRGRMFSDVLRRRFLSAACATFAIELAEDDPCVEDLCELARAKLRDLGKLGNADLFQARAGMYRGLSVCCLLIGLALFAAALIHGGQTYTTGKETSFHLTTSGQVAGAAMLLLIAAVCRSASLRFRAHRFHSVVVAFVAVSGSTPSAS